MLLLVNNYLQGKKKLANMQIHQSYSFTLKNRTAAWIYQALRLKQCNIFKIYQASCLVTEQHSEYIRHCLKTEQHLGCIWHILQREQNLE